MNIYCKYSTENLAISLRYIDNIYYLCSMKTIGNTMDYIKGNRIGSREAELENSSGWHAVRKVHRSKRSYKRKDKHQNKSGTNNPDFFCHKNRPSVPAGPDLPTQSFLAIRFVIRESRICEKTFIQTEGQTQPICVGTCKKTFP